MSSLWEDRSKTPEIFPEDSSWQIGVEGKSVTRVSYLGNTDRERFSKDQVEQVLGHLFSGLSVFHAGICDWLVDVDLSQQFLGDGSRTLEDWVSTRFDLRHSVASQLVRVARRLEDLPLLKERFAEGVVSLDQVDAISRMATPETEEALIEECLGLSIPTLDRAARRVRPPGTDDERSVWQRRHLGLQWNLDQSELDFRGSLPGAEGKIFESAVRDRADRAPFNPETGMFDPYPARLADGLVELCASTGDETGPGVPAQITVFADLDALISDSETTGVSELMAGPPIANETARRLSCDAIVECSVVDHGKTLGVGRRSGPSPAGCAVSSGTGTEAVSSPAVPGTPGCTAITSNTGPTAAPPICPI
jgi:hypothetical protein